MFRKMIYLALVLIACLSLTFMYMSTVRAATDGTLGATSTGTTNLSLTIPSMVKITKMVDFDFGTWSGSGSLSANEGACIFTNVGAGTYQVTATGNGIGGAFTLQDAGSNTLAYRVKWNDQVGTTGNVELTSGTVLNGQTGANTSAQNCGGPGTVNSDYQIIMDNSALGLAAAGVYSGTVTFLVEPD